MVGRRPGQLYLSEADIEAQFNAVGDEDGGEDIGDLNGDDDGWVDEEGSDEETETPAVESIVDNSDESGNEEPEIVRPQRKKRKLLKDKLICNLEEALNPDNYDR